MPRDFSAELDKYDRLKEEIKNLYQLKVQLEAIIYWPESEAALTEAQQKLKIARELIPRKEVELSLLEKRLPPPTIPSVTDDWVWNPDAPSKPFDKDAWLEEREKERKKDRTRDRER